MGLQKNVAGLFRTPRAAGHLVEELVRTFGGAQVPSGKPEIGVDHTHQRQSGEVVALREHLRATRMSMR